MSKLESGLDQANDIIDLLIPFTGKIGLGIAGVLALYNTFRRESPTPELYPELSTLEMAQLLKKRAQALVSAVDVDIENIKNA